jgi:hypothetical protein
MHTLFSPHFIFFSSSLQGAVVYIHALQQLLLIQPYFFGQNK